ncbi:MAG TPA: tetratricopeptide repeat protein [Bryobacteraceae bacterium]|nr:tetratricopeptide repeat protein [Bryobacteraceae bacterium]
MFRFVVFSVLLAATFPVSAQEQAWLQQAREAVGKGDFGAARAAASKALSQNPASAEAEVILGLADTAEEQLPSAEKHFAKAVSLQPSNYRAHTYLGSTYLRRQRLADAQREFSRVLQLSPGNAVAQYNLGVIATLQRKPAVALPFFTAVHRSDPTDAAALVALLECQVDLKQSRAAGASVQELEKLLPADSPVLLQVGTTLATRGEYALALPLLRRFAGANPRSLDAKFNLGLALLNLGNLDEAEATARGLLQDAPKAETYNLLGSILEKKGETKGAVQAFAEAARSAPTNEDFRIDYGSSLMNADSLDEAIAAFSRAVADLPQSLRLRLGLGSALYLAGRYGEAARALLECVHGAPTFAPAYDLLGKMFESAPELYGEITQAFRKYLQSGAPNAAAHAHYAAMLYTRAEGEDPARFAPAKQHLRKALQLNPRLAPAHVQLGMIHQAEGNLPEALASYRRGVALAPDLASARYRLASMYQKLGDQAKARVELDAFRKLKEREKEEERKGLVRGVTARD